MKPICRYRRLKQLTKNVDGELISSRKRPPLTSTALQTSSPTTTWPTLSGVEALLQIKKIIRELWQDQLRRCDWQILLTSIIKHWNSLLKIVHCVFLWTTHNVRFYNVKLSWSPMYFLVLSYTLKNE